MQGLPDLWVLHRFDHTGMKEVAQPVVQASQPAGEMQPGMAAPHLPLAAAKDGWSTGSRLEETRD